MQNTINNIVVFRQIIGARTTLGQMYLNGEYVGYTLEDTLRPFPLKVYGETAISEGMYKCEKYNSSKFGECLAIENVPNFTHIRIHGMNTHKDSLGCIGLGVKRDREAMSISSCRPALDKLLNMIDDSKPIYISIVNQIGIV